jgi:hypothetical protein
MFGTEYFSACRVQNAFVQAALSAGGYGDMLKSIYDTDNDGVVDNAENSDTVDGLHKTDIFAFKGIVGSGYITDFNNALEVGIYTITDLTGVLNIPPDGPSYGILEVGIASQGMYKVQKFYSVRGDVNMPIWIRMGNESFWGPWERIPKFSEILKSKSAFAGDFNNCRETGMYSINDFAGCSNYPPNAYSYGTLIVFNGSATADTYAIGQMYLSHGNSEIWYRGGYGGSGWQGWTKSYNQYSISKGTANPSGGQDGDIYLQYV